MMPGNITVYSDNLDRDEFSKVYFLEVAAVDKGTPPLSGTMLKDHKHYE